MSQGMSPHTPPPPPPRVQRGRLTISVASTLVPTILSLMRVPFSIRSLSSDDWNEGGFALGSNWKSGGISCVCQREGGQCTRASVGVSGVCLAHMCRDEALHWADVGEDSHLREHKEARAVAVSPSLLRSQTLPSSYPPPASLSPSTLYPARTLFTLVTTPSTTSPLNGL